jgi:hypothetical protein
MLKQQVKLLANEVSVALLYDVKSKYSKQRTFVNLAKTVEFDC